MSAVDITLNLEPLDPLFFRGGRPFDAHAPAAGATLPLPQTLTGALRTHLLQALGCDFARLNADMVDGATFEGAAKAHGFGAVARLEVTGPFLARDRRTLYPAPATLVAPKGNPNERSLLQPSRNRPQGWFAPEPNRPLVSSIKGATNRLEGFLDADGAAAFLTGTVPVGSIVRPSELFGADRRTGIALGPANTAAEGMIYTAEFLSLTSSVRFVAGLAGAESNLVEAIKDHPVMSWGGERKRVKLSVARTTFALPETATTGGDGTLLWLLTPAPLTDEVTRAAIAYAIPRPLPVSGWDLARGGPKPTRFLAPAGSVLFYAHDTVPTAVCAEDDRRLGFGRFAKGIWSYA